ncbi:MAG: hypothetical protein DRO10_04305 [Thermoprotei archaeon]|nr:MAG: hypothetical protein DRO10_04305 [Thermoprotei archaeon]
MEVRLRVIIAGGGDFGVFLATELIKRKHDVTIIEKDPERARKLSEEMDCAVINGDATHPETLKNIDLSKVDWLVAATGHDKDNILIGLLARNMGAGKVTILLEDVGYESLAISLGFEDIIVPTSLAASEVMKRVFGQQESNITPVLKGDVKFYVATVGGALGGTKLSELNIPPHVKVCAVFRGNEYLEAEGDLELKPGDEVLLLVREKDMEKLKELFEHEQKK